MKTIVHLDLDDDQRRQVASLLAGKPVKRLATRQEIVKFVKDAFIVELAARQYESAPDTSEADRVLHTIRNRDKDAQPEFCSNDCCRRNDLLQSRVNVLQHRLDTGR